MHFLKPIAIGLATILIIATSITVALISYEQASAEYHAEAKCIASYIASGIERKDIIVSSGKCSVKQ